MVVRLSGTQPQGPKHLETLENKTVDGTQNTVRVNRGITANRPAFPVVGELYFDTTLNKLIQYFSTGWDKVSPDPAPEIISISPTTASTTGTIINITGLNFRSGATVQFIGTNSTSYNSPVVTFVSETSITATTPELFVSFEPYDVKVINNDNKFSILENALDVGGTPAWNTASGTIATIDEQTALNVSVSATDPDGTSISYSSSNLPAWISLNLSTGALTGTAPDIQSDTTYTFDITASDGVNSLSRSFNVISKYVIPQTYFLSYDQGENSESLYIYGNAIDANDNIYVIGQRPSNGYLAKYDKDGIGQWYRKFYESNGSPYDWGIGLGSDSNDNIYACHTTDLSGSNNPAISIVNKSNGTFLSTKFLQGASGNNYVNSQKIHIDSSNNLYITGQGHYDGGGFKAFTIKFNSSLVMQWQRRYGGSTTWYTGYDVVTDSSQNVYACGRLNATGTYQPYLLKYNSSGTLQWQKGYNQSGSGDGYAYRLAIDSNNNIYMITLHGSGTNRVNHLVRLNTDGVVQWQRKISGDSFFSDLTIDSNGFIYLIGSSNITSKTGLIIKYDSSGAIIWQRTLSESVFSGIVKIKNSTLHISYYWNTSTSLDLGGTVKLPIDGSKTGTYSNGAFSHTYAAGSLSDQSGSLSVSTLNESSSTETFSEPTGLSMTNVSYSPTRVRKVI